jgi:hypothetical protein
VTTIRQRTAVFDIKHCVTNLIVSSLSASLFAIQLQVPPQNHPFPSY